MCWDIAICGILHNCGMLVSQSVEMIACHRSARWLLVSQLIHSSVLCYLIGYKTNCSLQPQYTIALHFVRICKLVANYPVYQLIEFGGLNVLGTIDE